ncbi:hypothetical protein AAMO2058_001420900 [Amorphochlora amoebiformis]|uniref:Uncharacterized protein n=1 Tax=Amorphochlora amoebiformis TaxID=1561963 RepID=A0A7S0DJ03_9EUKA|mmetsp:Transcript_26865/g.42630  ORF Transcript_26865/g.42630 Transcript_26865/m.42630 type:complete len:297 (+) Transcript_26865:62-952(+)
MSVKKSKNPVVALSAGCIAGGIEATCVWPMEYIKTQLQLKQAATLPYSGVYSGISYTVRTTGFISLYRGLLPTLIGSMPKAGIRFGGNTYFRQKLTTKDGNLTMGRTFVSGLMAGCLEATLAVTPIETVKTKCIEMNAPFFSGVKTILNTEGISGLYKGLVPTMLKQGSNQGLRFMWFAKYKEYLTGEHNPSKQRSLSPHEAFLGGTSAGCFSTLCNNPIDFVKTRMQGIHASKYRNSWDCLSRSVREEGFLALYRGVLPRLGRVVPGQGIIFMSFEIIQAQIEKIVVGTKKKTKP